MVELISPCIDTEKNRLLDSALVLGPQLQRGKHIISQCLYFPSSMGKVSGEERVVLFIFVNFWLNHPWSVYNQYYFFLTNHF